MIIKKLVVGPFQSNCYIVGAESSGEGMIVDAGAEAQKIVKAAKELKLNIKVVVLTHGHIDHVSAVSQVKEATSAPVAVHTDDAAFIREPRNSMFGIAQPAVAPDRLLKGGDSITVGDLSFLVLHTPGHSPGSICLLGQGVLFSGDTLFNYGIGRYDLNGGSYDELMDSLHGKLMVLPDDTVVYPGHGPDTTIARERRGNPFLVG